MPGCGGAGVKCITPAPPHPLLLPGNESDPTLPVTFREKEGEKSMKRYLKLTWLLAAVLLLTLAACGAGETGAPEATAGTEGQLPLGRIMA